MKKAMVLAITPLFLIVGCSSYTTRITSDGRIVRGAKAAVQKTNGQTIQGELIAVRKDSLLLSETARWINIKDVKGVELSETRKGYPGYVLLGFVAGAGVGGLLAPKGGSMSDLSQRISVGLSLMFVGALAGAWIAAQIEASKDIGIVQIEGIHHPEELERALQTLRSYARYPNYE